MKNEGRAAAVAHPSLALVKYWGKADSIRNIPATPSLALTLAGLSSRTEVTVLPAASSDNPRDSVMVNSRPQDPARYADFFDAVRRAAGAEDTASVSTSVFRAVSTSDFPVAAGLASSASGFAALALASVAAAGLDLPLSEISALARIGSASAARSLWGGFVRLDAGAEYAEPVHDENWWPEIRVVVARTSSDAKKISSREAMERCRTTSPYYDAWISDAPVLMDEACAALESRDLAALGPVIRNSYMRMFGAMLSADPPVVYWNEGSMAAIRRCGELRSDGLQAWETMDAGPQVKVFCPAEDSGDIAGELARLPSVETFICSPGPSACLLET